MKFAVAVLILAVGIASMVILGSSLLSKDSGRKNEKDGIVEIVEVGDIQVIDMPD